MTEETIVARPEASTFLMRIKRWFWIAWLFFLFCADRVGDFAADHSKTMRREKDLFFGTALVILGLFNFNSSKYCDGNTADYLSCTRPSTYYYFDALDITLIVIGTFLILLWLFKERPVKHR